MLTGDKLETATCIAKSSHLVSRSQDIHVFKPVGFNLSLSLCLCLFSVCFAGSVPYLFSPTFSLSLRLRASRCLSIREHVSLCMGGVSLCLSIPVLACSAYVSLCVLVANRSVWLKG